MTLATQQLLGCLPSPVLPSSASLRCALTQPGPPLHLPTHCHTTASTANIPGEVRKIQSWVDWVGRAGPDRQAWIDLFYTTCVPQLLQAIAGRTCQKQSKLVLSEFVHWGLAACLQEMEEGNHVAINAVAAILDSSSRLHSLQDEPAPQWARDVNMFEFSKYWLSSLQPGTQVLVLSGSDDGLLGSFVQYLTEGTQGEVTLEDGTVLTVPINAASLARPPTQRVQVPAGCGNPHVVPAGEEWRFSLKVGDLVDFSPSFQQWCLAVVVDVTGEYSLSENEPLCTDGPPAELPAGLAAPAMVTVRPVGAPPGYDKTLFLGSTLIMRPRAISGGLITFPKASRPLLPCALITCTAGIAGPEEPEADASMLRKPAPPVIRSKWLTAMWKLFMKQNGLRSLLQLVRRLSDPAQTFPEHALVLRAVARLITVLLDVLGDQVLPKAMTWVNVVIQAVLAMQPGELKSALSTEWVHDIVAMSAAAAAVMQDRASEVQHLVELPDPGTVLLHTWSLGLGCGALKKQLVTLDAFQAIIHTITLEQEARLAGNAGSAAVAATTGPSFSLGSSASATSEDPVARAPYVGLNLTAEAVRDTLHSVAVLDMVMAGAKHAETIKRVAHVAKFMAEHGELSPDFVTGLWQVFTEGYDTEQEAASDCLCVLLPALSGEPLVRVYKLLCATPAAQWTRAHVNLLGAIASSAPASDGAASTGPAVSVEALLLLTACTLRCNAPSPADLADLDVATLDECTHFAVASVASRLPASLVDSVLKSLSHVLAAARSHAQTAAVCATAYATACAMPGSTDALRVAKVALFASRLTPGSSSDSATACPTAQVDMLQAWDAQLQSASSTRLLQQAVNIVLGLAPGEAQGTLQAQVCEFSALRAALRAALNGATFPELCSSLAAAAAERREVRAAATEGALFVCLDFISVIAELMSVQLQLPQVAQLWQAAHQLGPAATAVLYTWLLDAGNRALASVGAQACTPAAPAPALLLQDDVMGAVFQDMLSTPDFTAAVSGPGADLLLAYFLLVNAGSGTVRVPPIPQDAGGWKFMFGWASPASRSAEPAPSAVFDLNFAAPQGGQIPARKLPLYQRPVSELPYSITSADLQGVDVLWAAALRCEDSATSKRIVSFVTQLQQRLPAELAKSVNLQGLVVSRATSYLAGAVSGEDGETAGSSSAAQSPVRPPAAPGAPASSPGLIKTPSMPGLVDEQKRAATQDRVVSRCVDVLASLLAESSGALGDMLTPPHSQRLGQRISVQLSVLDVPVQELVPHDAQAILKAEPVSVPDPVWPTPPAGHSVCTVPVTVRDVSFTVYEGETLLAVRRALSVLLRTPDSSLRMAFRGVDTSQARTLGSTLRELGVSNGCVLVVSAAAARSDDSASSDEMPERALTPPEGATDEDTPRKARRLAREPSNAGSVAVQHVAQVLAQRCECFDALLRAVDSDAHPRVSLSAAVLSKVWDFLRRLQTHPRVLHRILHLTPSAQDQGRVDWTTQPQSTSPLLAVPELACLQAEATVPAISSLRALDSSSVQWDSVLHTSSPALFLYSLQVIERLLVFPTHGAEQWLSQCCARVQDPQSGAALLPSGSFLRGYLAAAHTASSAEQELRREWLRTFMRLNGPGAVLSAAQGVLTTAREGPVELQTTALRAATKACRIVTHCVAVCEAGRAEGSKQVAASNAALAALHGEPAAWLHALPGCARRQSIAQAWNARSIQGVFAVAAGASAFLECEPGLPDVGHGALVELSNSAASAGSAVSSEAEAASSAAAIQKALAALMGLTLPDEPSAAAATRAAQVALPPADDEVPSVSSVLPSIGLAREMPGSKWYSAEVSAWGEPDAECFASSEWLKPLQDLASSVHSAAKLVLDAQGADEATARGLPLVTLEASPRAPTGDTPHPDHPLPEETADSMPQCASVESCRALQGCIAGTTAAVAAAAVACQVEPGTACVHEWLVALTQPGVSAAAEAARRAVMAALWATLQWGVPALQVRVIRELYEHLARRCSDPEAPPSAELASLLLLLWSAAGLHEPHDGVDAALHAAMVKLGALDWTAAAGADTQSRDATLLSLAVLALPASASCKEAVMKRCSEELLYDKLLGVPGVLDTQLADAAEDHDAAAAAAAASAQLSPSQVPAPGEIAMASTRHATVTLLAALCWGSPAASQHLMSQLYPLVQAAPAPYSWHFSTATDKRGASGYSGLVNLGCICYMNAQLQQLFMIGPLRAALLSVDAGQQQQLPQESQDNLLYQLQRMFFALEKSERAAFNPKAWCNAYKDESGTRPISVLVQQDSQEFLTMLIDRLERQLKHSRFAHLFEAAVTGKLQDQLVWLDGSRKSRDSSCQPFYAATLKVRGVAGVHEALDELVRGSLLDGFKDDDTGEVVPVRKRTVFDALPNTLMLHLNRFEMNFETFQTEKVSTRFEFPHELDMYPYSREGVAWAEECAAVSDAADAPERPYSQHPAEYYQYTLVGVVIHMGSIDSGHYYSFIRERGSAGAAVAARRGVAVPTGNAAHNWRGDWFEFNDSSVTPFDLSQLEKEAFGGGDDAGKSSLGSSRCAYLLVYERVSQLEVSMKMPVAEAEQYAANGLSLLPMADEEDTEHVQVQLPFYDFRPSADAPLPPGAQATVSEVEADNAQFCRAAALHDSSTTQLVTWALRSAAAPSALPPIPMQVPSAAPQLLYPEWREGEDHQLLRPAPSLASVPACLSRWDSSSEVTKLAKDTDEAMTLGGEFSALVPYTVALEHLVSQVAHNRDHSGAASLAATLVSCVTALPGLAAHVLARFTCSKARLLQAALLDCPHRAVRIACGELVVASFCTVLQGAEITYDAMQDTATAVSAAAEPVSVGAALLARFVRRAVCSQHMMEAVARNWKRQAEFFAMVHSICLTGQFARHCLLHNEGMALLCHAMMGVQSPMANFFPPMRTVMGNKHQDPDFTAAWSVVAMLMRSCTAPPHYREAMPMSPVALVFGDGGMTSAALQDLIRRFSKPAPGVTVSVEQVPGDLCLPGPDMDPDAWWQGSAALPTDQPVHIAALRMLALHGPYPPAEPADAALSDDSGSASPASPPGVPQLLVGITNALQHDDLLIRRSEQEAMENASNPVSMNLWSIGPPAPQRLYSTSAGAATVMGNARIWAHGLLHTRASGAAAMSLALLHCTYQGSRFVSMLDSLGQAFFDAEDEHVATVAAAIAMAARASPDVWSTFSTKLFGVSIPLFAAPDMEPEPVRVSELGLLFSSPGLELQGPQDERQICGAPNAETYELAFDSVTSYPLVSGLNTFGVKYSAYGVAACAALLQAAACTPMLLEYIVRHRGIRATVERVLLVAAEAPSNWRQSASLAHPAMPVAERARLLQATCCWPLRVPITQYHQAMTFAGVSVKQQADALLASMQLLLASRGVEMLGIDALQTASAGAGSPSGAADLQAYPGNYGQYGLEDGQYMDSDDSL